MPVRTSYEAVIMYRYLDIPLYSVNSYAIFFFIFPLWKFCFSSAVVLRQLVLYNEEGGNTGVPVHASAVLSAREDRSQGLSPGNGLQDFPPHNYQHRIPIPRP